MVDNEVANKLGQTTLGIKEVPLPRLVRKRIIEVLEIGVEVRILSCSIPE